MIKRLFSATVAALLLTAPFTSPLFARNIAKQKQQAREQYIKAEKLREALNGKPEADRSRREYERVLEAYRKVYYTSPTSAKADAAVVVVAELLARIGRDFNDPKMLQAAIGQYEFLRREYPGSKYRVEALFTIGQIYKEDLNDKEQAKATFQEFLKRYPRSELKGEARKAVAEIDNPSAGKNDRKAPAVTKADRTKERIKQDASTTSPAKSARSEDNGDEKALDQRAEDLTEPKAEKAVPLPLVTGIRHWSTPDYTRVAIDLDTEVKYEAGRIANPDRIFFDLHDTKLASTLVGKTFDVQDGFLRKIRVAQFQRGMTRVVLDVADVSDYSAFLLPNPYRLIIDIHGKNKQQRQTLIAKKQAESTEARNAADSESASAQVQTDNSDTAKAIPPSPAPKPRDEKPTPAPSQKAEIKTAEKKVAEVEKTLKKTEGDVTAEDTTITIAKSQPELKATPKPTSEPTFESVSPRENAKAKSRRRKRPSETAAPITAREARPTSNGERSLIRALGLKIGKIVVDAGHGGHDTGTIGPSGYYEKDLVLDVALRLGKLLEKKMGAEVVYTRNDDTFVPLETRTAIANQAQADMFISIHANSSNDPDARGVETYYLNFTSSPEALEVAARENAVSAKSIHELQDLVKKITLKDKIDESREFAADVQKSLHSGIAGSSPAVRNRGVKKAPFIVLIGANMPSILAEISFLSNPADEKRLQTPQYRQNLAEYLYRGIERYVSGLSGVKVASAASTASTLTQKAPKQIDDSDR